MSAGNDTDLAAACSIGLVALLVSPVSWIHHAVWIVPILGVIAWDGTEVRRIAIGCLVALVFVLRLPLFGSQLQDDGSSLLGDLSENAYVVAYLALLVLVWRYAEPGPRRGSMPGSTVETVP